MASLTVGDVCMNFLTVRTESFSSRAIMDPSQRHYECTEIALDLVAVVSEVATTSNKLVQRAVGPDNPGDSLPFAMNQLSKYLVQPRRPITYEVAGIKILDTPEFNPNGTRLPCDPKGGPFPQAARFVQISGDQTAVLLFRVVTHVTDADNFVLNHGWDIRSSIDQRGYTTRVINGRMAFRVDLLQDTPVDGVSLQPDYFRGIAFPPVAAGMRRVHVDVTQPRTMDELQYVIVEKEVTSGLGLASEVTSVQGTVTATYETNIRTPKDVGKLVADVIGKGFRGEFNGAVLKVLDTVIPQNRNVGVARAYGRKGANRANLARVARAFILDRFSPLKISNRLVIPAASVTHNLDTDEPPFAEVRFDVFGINPIVGPEDLVTKDAILNLSDEYLDSGGSVVASGVRPAPGLPAGSGSRGTALTRMVSQRLASPTEQTELPDDPPPLGLTSDFNKA